MICIFCDKENNSKSIEHIVSESFGNKYYLMKKGSVCDACNTRFSKFEDTALTNTVFVMERARFGIATKKGKNVKGKVKDLIITGDAGFKINRLSLRGINKENIKHYDPKTGIAHIRIPSFDKSEVAASKLVLKIGLESIYKSQRQLFEKYDFTELKNFLSGKDNKDWPFLTTDYEIVKYKSVPRLIHKALLKQTHCELKFLEINAQTLLFKFKYGSIPITLNLLNRDLIWIPDVLSHDESAMLYPEHFKNKLPAQQK